MNTSNIVVNIICNNWIVVYDPDFLILINIARCEKNGFAERSKILAEYRSEK